MVKGDIVLAAVPSVVVNLLANILKMSSLFTYWSWRNINVVWGFAPVLESRKMFPYMSSVTFYSALAAAVAGTTYIFYSNFLSAVLKSAFKSSSFK